MGSATAGGRVADVGAVVTDYRWARRAASLLLFLGAITLLLFSFARGSLAIGVAVGVGLIVLLRVPIVGVSGRTILRIDEDSETVAAAFRGPQPPNLAFQWGIADAVRSTEDGAVYDLEWLFGLQSTEMTVAVEERSEPNAFRIAVTTDERPWATYDVSIADDDATRITIDWESDRRFGPRQLPLRTVADRYLPRALAIQGYEIVERQSSVTVLP